MKDNKIRSTIDIQGVLGITFSLMGIIFLLVGGGFFLTNYMFMRDADKTVGVITDIEQYRMNKSSDENNGHNVTVEYNIDGRQYTEELSEYSSDMHEGDEIALYYHPGSEEDVRTGKVSVILSIVFGLIGIGFGLCGLIFVIRTRHDKKKAAWLRENGRRVYAMVNECIVNKKVRINGKHPFVLKCRSVNDFTGEDKWYISSNTIVNVSGYIGSSITIYVDPANENKYVVDLDSLLVNDIESKR